MPITSRYFFCITKWHSRLAWLTNIDKSHRVPAETVKQLAKSITLEEAKNFVTSTGLKTTKIRASESCHSISIAPPEGFEEYYGPQIVLPKIDCPEVPIGSVLMNVLLPPISDPVEAERVFQNFQTMVRTISKKLDALPFACITGHKCKKEEYRHDLFLRGFRFFFGPEPDVLYQRIFEILTCFSNMFVTSDANERQQLAAEFQRLKFCQYEGKRISHSLLEDVKLMVLNNYLVDLRPQSPPITPTHFHFSG